ncbi:CatB-related O-acetyltransferase [Clostridium sp. LP20]|uniref:CatB-related O-acetyltransferase n=1 Tax=Clostridium sp. LP20 TaxID=3418665 RepID=UPI003EE6C3CD
MADMNVIKELEELRERMKLVHQGYATDGVKVGDFTYGVPTIYYKEQGSRLSIGKFCAISEFVNIFLGGEHRTNWVSTYPFHAFITKYLGVDSYPSKGDVTIGNDVWIASSVTILSGVTIGDGVCIGANSVVAKDIPDYAIVAGNPARIIRYRFNPDIIEKLLKTTWWNWELEYISEAIPIILSEDITKLFDYYERVVKLNLLK